MALNLTKVMKRKSYKPEHPKCKPSEVDKYELSHCQIFECRYNEDLKPVCPFCGTLNAQTVEYGYTSPSQAHRGDMYFIGVCRDCNRLVIRYKNLSEI